MLAPTLSRSLLCLATLVCLAILGAAAPAQTYWQPPPTPSGNPTTPDKVLLGKALFWEEQLSSTNSVACGTCHIFSHGGGDPRSSQGLHPGPDGIYGTADDSRGSPGVPKNFGSGSALYGWDASFGSAPQVTPRTAPSVINAAYQTSLFWDGRTEDSVFRDPLTLQVVLTDNAQLENLIAAPPLNEIEMGHAGRSWSDVVAKVQNAQPLALASNLPAPLQAFVAGKSYPQLFQQVYGTPVVDASRVILSIAAYIRTLVSDLTPVDDFTHNNNPTAITSAEFQGFLVFNSFCSGCHLNHVTLPGITPGPIRIEFANSGVRPISEDPGRSLVTGSPVDDGKFKAPDLRNVALRGPFFHNGGPNTLAEVVDFYNRGGDFHVNQSNLMQAVQNQLSATERANLVAVLRAMTDPRVENESPPFDRPTLFAEGPNRNQSFGAATAGSGGRRPRAIAVEPAYLGAPSVTLAVDTVEANQFAFLGLDAAPAPSPIPALGVDIHVALSPAIQLLAPGTTLGSGPGNGHLSWSFAVPAQSSLQGYQLYGQWLVTDPGGTAGFASTAGFRVTVF
ncbi:MAG: cytochrome-c peroxidase [Planctomycetota bacterium]